jgi:hypothetical protein
MSYQILRCDGHLLNMRTRMPFRFGITTMTATPHLFLSVEVGMDGQRARGIAADHLPQKWLTKNPKTSVREDVTEMIRVIRHAVELALALPPVASPFQLWRELYTRQAQWADRHGVPPLLANFGVSLIERAMLDAVCRTTETRFADALRRNTLGIQDVPLELLPSQPLRSVIARHTVGLSDPITTSDIPPGERLDDGLPQSLDECIRDYGLTHFKIKLCGDVAEDAARLRRLADVIARNAPTCAFTVDGNENFHALGPFRELWQSLARDPALRSFLANLIFVEQPLHRDVALSDAVKREMLAWPDRPPIIIDESDATLASLPAAIDCGYAGTSHKNCKGIFKGIRNACLIAGLRRSRPESRWLLSGEDLSNVGPVSQMQDLALMANLGIDHVERNGHHYFKGLSFLPHDVQETVLKHHGDLYRRHPRGYATLDVRQGSLDVSSTVDAPFGVAFELDPSRFTPLDEWTFDSIAGAAR